MKHIVFGLFLSLLGVAVSIPATSPAAAETETEPCCFSNPRYSGQCKVTPGPEEKCVDILSYLNSQNSTGKSYCGNTPVRGGWASVTCEETEMCGAAFKRASSQPQAEKLETR